MDFADSCHVVGICDARKGVIVGDEEGDSAPVEAADKEGFG